MIKHSKDFNFILLMAMVYGLAVLPLSFELPAINVIAAHFNLSNTSMKFTITLFWAMFTLGQFICAYLLPRMSVSSLVFWVISLFSLSFVSNTITDSGYIFFILRLFEGVCCGSLLLLGRYAMANKYGHDEKLYLLQFARLSSMITALTVIVPMLGGLMSEYLHWYLIYLLIGIFGLCMYPLRETIFIFKQTKLTSLKEDFDVVFRDVPLLFKSLQGGFARSIIVNFNTNLALFLLNHRHWSSVHYGSLMFFFSVIAIFSRLYLTYLKNLLGMDGLNYVLMSLLFISSAFFMFDRLYDYEALYFIAGAIVTMSSSLLATLYSSFAQFRLAKQDQAMSLAVMGVIQNTALVLGTCFSVMLANQSLVALAVLVMISTVVLYTIDYLVAYYDGYYQEVA